MIYVITGLIILILGLYLIPINEAKYTILKGKTPKWFFILAGGWLFSSIWYIFYICMILLEGLEKAGYTKSGGSSAALYTTALFFIFCVIIFKVYSNRLEKCKQEYEDSF